MKTESLTAPSTTAQSTGRPRPETNDAEESRERRKASEKETNERSAERREAAEAPKGDPTARSVDLEA